MINVVANLTEVGNDPFQKSALEILTYPVHVLGDENMWFEFRDHAPHLKVKRVSAVALLLRPGLGKALARKPAQDYVTRSQQFDIRMKCLGGDVPLVNSLIDIPGVAVNRCRIAVARIEEVKAGTLETKVEAPAPTEDTYNAWHRWLSTIEACIERRADKADFAQAPHSSRIPVS